MSEDLQQSVIGVFKQICNMNGYDGGNINGSTRPLQDLDGFDSLNAQEFCSMISAIVGRDIDIQDAFGDKGNGSTIFEIAYRLDKVLEDKGK